MYWDRSDFKISGQSLYPEQPHREEYMGFVAGEGADDWTCQLAMVNSPGSNTGVCWVVIGFGILPPYCEPGSLAKYCAHVTMYQYIAGPKRRGESYPVQHHIWQNVGMPPAEPPAIYASWDESGWGFPDYQSVSVSGSATVLSEDPFRLAFDVVFLDANGNRREVTVQVSPRYYTYCENN
ncbi:MAG TPA: hypothetical protein PK668_03350 [Myxococcota bacterium]|nr:hypothetical protein [Myxococcota bacterium]HRY91891.1 hypothetical protein [Myxococcota bacterium]HSA22370.1 hypothetical protein [Myxococcota bacterium]